MLLNHQEALAYPGVETRLSNCLFRSMSLRIRLGYPAQRGNSATINAGWALGRRGKSAIHLLTLYFTIK